MALNEWKNMTNFLEVFKWADEEVYRFCAELGQELILEEGDMLFHKDDDVRGFYLIWSGHLKTVVPGPRCDTISGIHIPGAVLGLSDLLGSGSHSRQAQALSSVKAIIIYKSEFLASLTTNPNISYALMRQMDKELSELEKRATNLIQQPSAQRLAGSLITLSKKFGTDTDGRLSVRFTPRDLANLICTTRTTIYRLLRQFEEEGLIGVDDSGIKLLRRDGLAKRSGLSA